MSYMVEEPSLYGNIKGFRNRHAPSGLDRTRNTGIIINYSKTQCLVSAVRKSLTHMFLIKWLFRMTSSKW